MKDNLPKQGSDSFSRKSTVPLLDQHSLAVMPYLTVALPDLANKKIGHPIKFEFSVHNEYFLV